MPPETEALLFYNFLNLSYSYNKTDCYVITLQILQHLNDITFRKKLLTGILRRCSLLLCIFFYLFNTNILSVYVAWPLNPLRKYIPLLPLVNLPIGRFTEVEAGRNSCMSIPLALNILIFTLPTS